MSPSLLVMDEPTAGLDPGSRRRLIQLLQRLETTLIISGHDLDLVAELCQRVIVLNDGQLRGDDTPERIFGDGRLLADCRLEPPLSQQGCARCGGRQP
jgi:cobalt/nickel transport system ATP-binding protein